MDAYDWRLSQLVVPLCLASLCLYSFWCPKKDKHRGGDPSHAFVDARARIKGEKTPRGGEFEVFGR